MNARVSNYRKTKKTAKQKKEDTQKNIKREKEGKNPKDYRSKQDIDPEAGSGCKGYKKLKDIKGNMVEIGKWFYGYKVHCSIENKNDLITSCIATSGNEPDGDYFEPLLWKDMSRRGVAKTYSADRGYDWGDNHFLLNQLDMGDAIILNDYRLKDEKHLAIWHKIANAKEYKEGKAQRYKVERTFGDMVNNLGIHHCRYFGRIKTALQMFMTAIAYNVKKAMKSLHGISLKQPTPSSIPI